MPEGLQQSRGGQSGPKSPAGAGAAVSEVSTSEAFQKQCTDTGGLCIIAAFDPTSAEFEAHKAAFQVTHNCLLLPSCCAASQSDILHTSFFQDDASRCTAARNLTLTI